MLCDDFDTTNNLLKQNILKSSSSRAHPLLLWFKGPGFPLWRFLKTKSNTEKNALVLLASPAVKEQQIAEGKPRTEGHLIAGRKLVGA